jgi:RimJ/RimL family protein N-acetyltransferase
MSYNREIVRNIINEKIPVKVPICDPQNKRIGHLSPLTVSAVENDEILEKLTQWRNRHSQHFLTRFTATPERTKAWLRDTVLPDDSRLMFLIYYKDKLVGHNGFRHLTEFYNEGDNLIRGERGGGINFMYYACVAQTTWIFNSLGIESAKIKVLSVNEGALIISKKLGYKVEKEVNIYMREEKGEKIIGEVGEPHQLIEGEGLLYMTLTKKDYFETLNSLWDAKGVELC